MKQIKIKSLQKLKKYDLHVRKGRTHEQKVFHPQLHTPTQILQAAHKSMIAQYTDNDDDEITVKVEIKK